MKNSYPSLPVIAPEVKGLLGRFLGGPPNVISSLLVFGSVLGCPWKLVTS